ncbi:MAG: radical SAM protein [Clostridia bacterium]|nr:radical SAM protein [Clostridia bacterium]
MRTASVMLQNLCVPCGCRCRYCLLSWAGRCVGVGYERSERFARRFHDWIAAERPDVEFNFSFGYSMEHPRLFEALAFLRSIGSVGGEFLQCDGMRFRSAAEIDELMGGLRSAGVRSLNFTFYGTAAYHDRFAGRAGDYEHLLHMIDGAVRHGFETSAGIPLTRESASQADDLLDALNGRHIGRVFLFVPHAEGRGVLIDPIRFSQNDYNALSDAARALLNTNRFKTEDKWFAQGRFAEPETRSLLISLTPENIDRLEQTPFAEIIAEAERLDDEYYRALPSCEALARRYGNPDSGLFYGWRDLLAHYQKRFIQENNLSLYDVTDERYTGSRRY